MLTLTMFIKMNKTKNCCNFALRLQTIDKKVKNSLKNNYYSIINSVLRLNKYNLRN